MSEVVNKALRADVVHSRPARKAARKSLHSK
jgi:hypothetical protein